MIYILMGVSGSGKTTVGELLSQKTGIPFYDADNLHPKENIHKMASGTPLTDDDRRPWLKEIEAQIKSWTETGDAILACSALKKTYRDFLKRSSVPIQWIMLDGTMELIAERLAGRPEHFFDTALLKSQFETLEYPSKAWQFSINLSPESIASKIQQHIEQQECISSIGLIGLGVMGKSLSLNIATYVDEISVYNRHVEGKEEKVAHKFVATHPEFKNIHAFEDLIPFIKSLKKPRSVLIMVNAGDAVDAVIAQLRPLLDEGDCIIDCGNSHYKDTAHREKLLSEDKILYVGMGVSGGEQGARFGPSLMPGGSEKGFARLKDVFLSIAAKDRDGKPCCSFVGSGGAGHFVKMIHNGIEYAEMQLISECFEILTANQKTYEEIAGIFEDWNERDQQSYLLGITTDILGAKNDGEYLIDKIKDIASHKGTGSWSVRAGLDLHTPSASIYAALTARQYSSMYELRNELGGNTITGTGTKLNVDSLYKAYSAARLINHIIGFEIIRSAALEMGWNIHMSELARIWTNGCIIRSGLMEEFVGIFKTSEQHLLLHPAISEKLENDFSALRAEVSKAINSDIHVPVMTACFNYITALNSTNSGARLIAAQRDYFGAHGFYILGDSSGALSHFNWPTA